MSVGDLAASLLWGLDRSYLMTEIWELVYARMCEVWEEPGYPMIAYEGIEYRVVCSLMLMIE